MKRLTALVCVCLLMLAMLPTAAFADIAFTDLAPGHWAYANVQKLVSDGTIRGYEDGSFRPNGTVTRAEFVKMIGKGPSRYSADFVDVSPSHWAYEYVMHSGLLSEGNSYFEPNKPITRLEVIRLLWKRAGAPNTYAAPSAVVSQAGGKEEKQAVAWAYTCGIMNGDDGVSLHLPNTMSRAEGAALIVRSREKSKAGATVAFIDVVNEDLLKRTFVSLDLFDDNTYNPNKTVSYGELSRAAIRLASGEYEPSYFNFSSNVKFEHTYARDFDAIAKKVWSEEIVTKAKIDAPVTLGDAIAALSFSAWYRSAKPYAADLTTKEYESLPITTNRYLTFANRQGILIDIDSTLKTLERKATLKDIAAILLQFDWVLGLNTDYTTDTSAIGSVNYNHSLDQSGRTYPDFQLVLKDLPNAVYTTPFNHYGEKNNVAKSTHRFAKGFSSIFSVSLGVYRDLLAEKGLDCTITYYPSLVIDNGNGYTMRVKIKVNSLSGTSSIGTYFSHNVSVDPNYKLVVGKEFYADIASGAPLSSITMNPKQMYLDQIIY